MKRAGGSRSHEIKGKGKGEISRLPPLLRFAAVGACAFAFAFGAPPERRRRRTRPAGRRTWMGGVFRAGFDARSENPAGSADPVHRTGREGGVCFLCARFLCTGKERWLAPSRCESPLAL